VTDSSPTDDKVLVLAYGNPLRTDDGVGWRVAERLGPLVAPQRVEVLSLHQLVPELAEDASRARLVVFIDASVADPPGGIVRRAVSAPAAPGDVRTHHMTPATLLGLARQLYGRSAPGVLYSVGAACVEMGESLSPTVQAAMDDLVRQVHHCICEALRHA
jgi:hydrogenase maturation protease